MAYNQAALGNRFVCFECGCKFYDLNRPESTCPECSADQVNAPTTDIRTLLSGSGRPRVKLERKEELEETESETEDAEGFDLLGDDDDDDLEEED